MTKISIVIPTLNESSNLPLIFSDLSEIDIASEVIIVDANSEDSTKDIAKINGAKYFMTSKRNRGFQLNYGAKKANGSWLLFLHADSRLQSNWFEEIKFILKGDPKSIYFFKFKIMNKAFKYRLLELFVNLRSSVFKTPYGDQGMLINKKNFFNNNGFKDIPIMEDIDFITRFNEGNHLVPLRTSIFTSPRKWENKRILIQSIKNWNYRKRWLRGESLEEIYREYYKTKL